jgi:hypothetical protein
MATLLDDAADISDIIEYEKLAARWASSQAGVVKTEYGADEEMASVLRGDQDSFGNEIKLTALEPGRINYLNTGESMEVFKSGDRPAQAFQNFVQYLENRMCRAMGVSARVVLDRPSAGPEARKDLMQAERTFDFWRAQMESQLLNKVIRMVLMDAVVKGELPNDPNITRGEWQWPGSVSIDAGRDARADIELWRMGLATAAELYGENGHDWESSLRQRAKEAAFISQLAIENGVSTESISGGQPSVATDPNLAPDASTPAQGDITSIEDAAQSADSIQGTALNGAQVQALLELAQSVAQGLIPPESAKAIASAAFPLIPSLTLDSIFDGISVGQSVNEQDVASSALQSHFAVPKKYAHINFKPTTALADEAKRGLEWRDEFNRGGTEVGVARARDLSNRTNLSPETVRRMNSYLARHEVDKQGEGFSPGEDGFPSAGRIAWALWGGDAGQSWASARAAQMDAADEGEG